MMKASHWPGRVSSTEEVVRVLNELHARLIPIIRTHGDIVDKFMGDGVMATFGAVKRRPPDAADAFAATEEVLRTIHEWHAPTAGR